jgi:hypothetical protein
MKTQLGKNDFRRGFSKANFTLTCTKADDEKWRVKWLRGERLSFGSIVLQLKSFPGEVVTDFPYFLNTPTNLPFPMFV